LKKLLLALLCLSIVLLCGCQTVNIFAPTGSDEDYANFNVFLWNCQQGLEGAVTLSQARDDGSSRQITITFDGVVYTVADADGQRSYNYLISDTHLEAVDDGYRYGNYFFLTDDPNMTFSRYQQAMSSPLQEHMQLILPTELILGKTSQATSAAHYGTVPEYVADLFRPLMQGQPVYFGRQTFFLVEAGGKLTQYDYKGQTLITMSIPEATVIRAVSENDDGSVCVALDDPDRDNHLNVLCFNAQGKLRWQYNFPLQRNVRLQQLVQVDGVTFGFGTITTETSQDLYAVKFSAEGMFLKDVVFGGSGAEDFIYADLVGNTFILSGNTHSADGQMPFSEDGEAAGFSIKLNQDLSLSDAIPAAAKDPSQTVCGFYGSRTIFRDAAMVQPGATDQLSEDAQLVGIFTTGSGYAVLRQLTLEPYCFSDPNLPALSYCQFIATGYNAQGEPIWQFSSEPYLA